MSSDFYHHFYRMDQVVVQKPKMTDGFSFVHDFLNAVYHRSLWKIPPTENSKNHRIIAANLGVGHLAPNHKT